MIQFRRSFLRSVGADGGRARLCMRRRQYGTRHPATARRCWSCRTRVTMLRPGRWWDLRHQLRRQDDRKGGGQDRLDRPMGGSFVQRTLPKMSRWRTARRCGCLGAWCGRECGWLSWQNSPQHRRKEKLRAERDEMRINVFEGSRRIVWLIAVIAVAIAGWNLLFPTHTST